jgi:hypothetical protein
MQAARHYRWIGTVLGCCRGAVSAPTDVWACSTEISDMSGAEGRN